MNEKLTFKDYLKAGFAGFIFFLFIVVFSWLLFAVCGCSTFREALSEPIGAPWDSVGYKFRKEVRPEIQKKMAVVVGNQRVCLAMKQLENSVAPWQKILIINYLNEIVAVELGFQTRNDSWSPNLVRFNSIFVGVIPPKKAMLIVLPMNRYEIERRYRIKGRYLLIAEAHQRTATGKYVVGENVFYLNLGYRQIKKVDCGKFTCKVGNIIKLTRHNLRKPFEKSRSQRLRIETQFIRYPY